MGTVFTPTEETFPHTADAVVIGGGIVGTATAFWLSRAGLDTVVIERRGGLSTLTTSKSAECFRAQFTEPAMVELARPSIEVFENFAEVVGLPGYSIDIHQQGYLFLTSQPRMLDELQAAVQAYHRLGVTDAEFLSGDEARARFPFLSPAVLAATIRQRDGWLSAHELTYGFAKGSHARFLLRTGVTGIQLKGGAIGGVETTRGVISTRIVVDAAGPFAAQVAKMAGVELPIQTVRRQKVVVTAKGHVAPEMPMTIDVDNGSYCRPEGGGALFGWVDPDEPATGPLEDPALDWEFPAVCLDKIARLAPFWAEVAEKLRKADLDLSAGQYSYTPDDQPLLGPVPEVPGFHVN
ncbi:MAG: FAD-binding oxidoreductase, partial [Chloroflexi bacterium]|nr:FAD-binding oxidoreductase [Chloroflexota bacterium]